MLKRFESYAQQLEDVILYVALQDVEKVFYIDIGANDPVDCSVTKFFYDRGGQGINIEPLKDKCALLSNQRPRDINLCVGIGNKNEKLNLTVNGQLSSFSDVCNTGGGYGKITKSIFTLTDIYKWYCIPNQQVHFCKIDVEGFELQVLEGIKDWNIFRPWIFVIEAIEPRTDIPTYEKWEHILEKNGYVPAYSEGGNRYYVDNERREYLLERFSKVKEFFKDNEIVKMKMIDVNVFDFYMFPYEKVLPKSKIVLYAAGRVGRSYYKQIYENHYCEVVLWADKKYEQLQEIYDKVDSPDKLLEVMYDFIVIAVKYDDIAQRIVNDLVVKYNIDREKIVVHVPRSIEDFMGI